MVTTGLNRGKIESLLAKMERLPTLPGVAHRLLPLAMADYPNRREIQQAIESDASLAARAVQLAVETGAPADQITSIDQVFETVPLERLAVALLSVDIVDPETLRRGRLPRLWRHNLAVAMAAQVIAGRIGTVPAEVAHLAGILHDIGRIALPLLMPKAYCQVLERIETTGADVLEVERELLGVDHAVFGKRMAKRWGFSETLQNVIWLHHQTQVPMNEPAASGTLTQVVHLADLVASQAGLGRCAAEQVRENTAELAERLGLSGVHAEQIGLQVASAIDLNARPIGLEDEPTLSQLWRLLVGANARLGRLFDTVSGQSVRLKANARRADLLVRLNGALAGCRSPREVLEAVAATAADALRMRVVVAYLLGRNFEFVEGVRSTAERGLEEHFLCDVSKNQSLDTLLADAPGLPATPSRLMRAERIEGWLFERQGERLGEGPFYSVPMMVDESKVGGLVFALGDPSHRFTRQETGELLALTGMAGVAVKRAQAEADLVTLTEELAEVGRELEVAQEERLQRRNVASLSEMAAGAAHEINNPLAIISGRAQQLAASEGDPDRRATLETVIQQADRISDIIAELHRFARPPAPQFEKADPVELANQVIAELQPRVEGTPVDLRIEAPKQAPLITVDPVQVADALREVTQNAIEACHEGGTVTLMVQPQASEDAVRFVVVDDGPGMEPPVRARAFDPFYSGYEAGRHPGLGLPKAYRAIQVNGGQMALESTPGRGTTVRVTFSAAESPARA